MSRRDDLIALRDAVEADIHPRVQAASAKLCIAAEWPHKALMSAFNGSTDAALALLAAVLPGWGWQMWTAPDGGFYAAVSETDPWEATEHRASTPARALLLAILAALIEREARDDAPKERETNLRPERDNACDARRVSKGKSPESRGARRRAPQTDRPCSGGALVCFRRLAIGQRLAVLGAAMSRREELIALSMAVVAICGLAWLLASWAEALQRLADIIALIGGLP